MSFFALLNPDAPRSVTAVSTVDGAGKAYNHAMEPELAGATIPRVARLTATTVSIRRGLWNAALVLTGLVLHLAKNTWHIADWFFVGALVFGALAALILVWDRRLRKEVYLLRQGVAVHGLVRSGEVVDFGNTRVFQVRYTYWVGSGTCSGVIGVSAQEYTRWVGGNPYFTVLYDAQNPSRSLPYSCITAAELVAK